MTAISVWRVIQRQHILLGNHEFMSGSIPPNLSKAMSGHYCIPIKTIFLETWYRVKGMKATFWLGFLYFILVMAVTCMVLGLVLALYDVFVLPLATTHNAFPFYNLKLGLKFTVVGIVEILRFLLTSSLAYLALKHLRSESIHANMVFSFFQAWRPLVLVGLLLYLFNTVIFSSTHIFLNSELFQQKIASLGSILGSTFLLLIFLICFFLYFYFSIVVFMTVLLIFDQKIPIRKSLGLAFQSVNQHFFKNIFLIIITSIVFGLLALITLGIGLIWLLPMTSLVTAIQYNQIFCAGDLV